MLVENRSTEVSNSNVLREIASLSDSQREPIFSGSVAFTVEDVGIFFFC